MRQQLFAHTPLCVLCQKQGRITIATIRDHTIPLAEGGPDDETNVQPICEACHDVKTEDEAQRGVRRSRFPVTAPK